MRASRALPSLLVGLAVSIAVFSFIRSLYTTRIAEGARGLAQLHRELSESQLKLREQDRLLHEARLTLREQQVQLKQLREQESQRERLQHVGAERKQPPELAAGRGYMHSIATMPVRSGDWAMMTYATGGVHEMLYNWVLHIQRLGVPILAIAMDEQVAAQCNAKRFHCLDWSETASSLDGRYVRGDFSGFRNLGVRKVDALLAVLRAGTFTTRCSLVFFQSNASTPFSDAG